MEFHTSIQHSDTVIKTIWAKSSLWSKTVEKRPNRNGIFESLQSSYEEREINILPETQQTVGNEQEFSRQRRKEKPPQKEHQTRVFGTLRNWLAGPLW